MVFEFNCPVCGVSYITEVADDVEGNEEIVCGKCDASTSMEELFPEDYVEEPEMQESLFLRAFKEGLVWFDEADLMPDNY